MQQPVFNPFQMKSTTLVWTIERSSDHAYVSQWGDNPGFKMSCSPTPQPAALFSYSRIKTRSHACKDRVVTHATAHEHTALFCLS